jgi:N-acyl-D-amino-acid deacylase
MRRTRPFATLFLTAFLSACAGAIPPPVAVPPVQPQPGPEPPAPALVEPVLGFDYDLIIENGRVVDGTGSAWFYGDVAVKDGRIARIAPADLLRGATAAERVDAFRHVVSPGFIDIQSQSRYALLSGDSRVISKVTQGVTTEIMGEGTTTAPVNPAYLEPPADDDTEADRQARLFSGERGFDRWLRAMEARGTSVNQGSFLGGGTLRAYAVGSRMGEPGPAELDTMKAVVRRAMQDGAFGIATALIYAPGNFTSTVELGEVSAAMAPYGGVYITHLRSEADNLLEAIDEAIEIGARGGVPVEIFHLKAAGPDNWPKMAQAIEKIDSARAAGVDVQANMYPYVAGSTGLTSCLPPSASANGRLFRNLGDAEARARIRAEIENQSEDWENLCALSTPGGVLLLGFNDQENRRRYSGRYLDDVAREMGKDWIETAMDLVLDERQRIGTVFFMMSEDNVRLQIKQPWMKFGTDAGGVNPRTTTSLIHPRSYGTYTRILGRYVREQGVVPLEDAIRKMSSAVATRLSIPDRGVLREGFYADIVIFDPETVIDRATYENPHQPSEGIRDVYVNGVAVVKGGEHTDAKPGMIVRGPGYRPVLPK